MGWAWLPSGLAAPSVTAGRLVHIPSANFTNILNFFIDVVSGGDQALGLAAQRLVELLSTQATATRRSPSPAQTRTL